jgi:micrococcal nuclease
VRRDRLGSALLILVACLVLGRPWEGVETPWGGSEGEPREAVAYVIRAVDGDTIEVRVAGRDEYVRYIGVDTPETVKPGTPVQCFGPRAHRFDSRLVTHRRVRLVFGVEPHDIYGRLLAYVHLGHRFVNAELVRRGLARTLTIPPNDRFADLFNRLQKRASSRGRGLWGAC